MSVISPLINGLIVDYCPISTYLYMLGYEISYNASNHDFRYCINLSSSLVAYYIDIIIDNIIMLGCSIDAFHIYILSVFQHTNITLCLHDITI